MPGELKPVGARLVVEGSDQSAASWQKNATEAEGYRDVLLSTEKAAEQYNTALLRLAEVQARGAAASGDLTEAEQILYDALTDSLASVTEYERGLNLLEQIERKQAEAQAEHAQAVKEVTVEYGKQAEILPQFLAAFAEGIRQINQGDAALAKHQEQLKQVEVEYSKLGQVSTQVLSAYLEGLEKIVSTTAEVSQSVAQSAASFPAGSLFGDPSRAAEMQKVQAENARIAAEALAEAQRLVAESANQAAGGVENLAKQMMAQGFSAKEAAAALKDLGFSEKEVASATGITEEVQSKQTGTHRLLSESAIQSSRAFFALTLASFGLMSVSQELKKAFGDDLPPAFEKFTNAIQQVASFGSAGAFVGGGPGAVIGGIVGAVVALGTAAVQVDPQLQRLNQNLENLSHKDELVDTLSKVTGWTREMSQAMLDLAKTSPDVASALEKVADASRPMNELQLAIRGVWIEIDRVVHISPDAGSTIFTNLLRDLRLVHPELTAVINEIERLAQVGQAAAEQDKAVADDLLRVAEAGAKAGESTNVLVQGLHNLGMGDLKTQLAETADVSEELAKGFLDFANTHRDVAVEATDLAQKIHDEEVEVAKLQETLKSRPGDLYLQYIIKGLNQDIDQQKLKLQDLVNSHQAAADSSDKLAAAQQHLADAITESNFRMAQLNERTGNQYAAAQQQYNDAVMDAAEQRSNAVFSAEQSLTNKLADLWVDLKDKVADIQSQLADKQADIASELADKEADISSQLGDKLFDIQTQLSNKIEDIQIQLADRISSIQQDLQNKLADLAHKHTEDLQKESQKEADAARDLARRLFEIERDRIEATAALSFNTAEQLRNAQTDHDREAILRRHLFEQSQIDQKANDARNDANDEYAKKVQEAEREKKLADDNYRYEVELAKRLAQQQIEEAQRRAAEEMYQAERTAQQQIVVAQREAAQQRAIAEREAAEKLAVAQREAQQQLALAQRRYAEETAQAQRAFAQQVEAARRAEAQRTADAYRALQERNAAIAQSYALERQQIQHTLEMAILSYQRQIAEIKNLVAAMQILLQKELELAGVYEFLAKTAAGVTVNLFSDWINRMKDLGSLNMIGSSGNQGSNVVPPIIQNLFGGNTTVNPPSTHTTTSSSHMTIIINDATDPKKVAETVRRELESVAWR